MSEWKSVLLADVAELRNGAGVKQDFFSSSGVPLVRVSDFTNDSVDMSGCNFVDPDHAVKWSSHLLNEGDVVVATVGSWPPNLSSVVGKVVRIPKSAEGAIQNQNTCCVLPKSGELDKDFLYYRLKLEDFAWHAANGAGGSANQARLPVKKLGEFSFQIPAIEFQTVISEILRSLDRKIHLNTHTNQTLESIAQAIFKSWFVDFEPVKAKMAAKERWYAMQPTSESASPVCYAEEAALPDLETYTNLAAMCAISGKSETELTQLQQQNPDHYQQLAETAALFPSAMVDSELGEIPEGWEVGNLGSISSLITKGTTPTKSDIGSTEGEQETFFLKVKDISESRDVIRTNIEKIPTSVSTGPLKRSIVKTDDMLFSIAGTIGRTAIVDEDLNGANTNQALAIIRLSNPSKWLSFAWFNLISDRIQNEITSKVVQGVQANASLANIRDITLLIPGNGVIDGFNKITNSILLEKRLLAKNTRDLAELRDSLLPKLLSGELSVSDKEEWEKAVK